MNGKMTGLAGPGIGDDEELEEILHHFSWEKDARIIYRARFSTIFLLRCHFSILRRHASSSANPTQSYLFAFASFRKEVGIITVSE